MTRDRDLAIAAPDMTRILTSVAPLTASGPDAIHPLDLIIIRATGAYVTATATDRYVAGSALARRSFEPGMPEGIWTMTRDAARFVTASRADVIPGSMLRDADTGVEAVSSMCSSLLRQALDSDQAVGADEPQFDLRLLKKFTAAARFGRLDVKLRGPMQGAGITSEGQFAGMVMPIRQDGRDRDWGWV